MSLMARIIIAICKLAHILVWGSMLINKNRKWKYMVYCIKILYNKIVCIFYYSQLCNKSFYTNWGLRNHVSLLFIWCPYLSFFSLVCIFFVYLILVSADYRYFVDINQICSSELRLFTKSTFNLTAFDCSSIGSRWRDTHSMMISNINRINCNI